MVLDILGFLRLSWVDILDILVVASIIFVIFRWIRGTSAMHIFLAILFLFLVRIIAVAMNMKMLSALMGTVIDVGAIALLVIFQPEIRQFLNRVGRSASLRGGAWNFIDKLLGRSVGEVDSYAVSEITEACRTMAQEKTGALIVLQRKDDLDRILQTGDSIDAKVSHRLLCTLFFKNTPLHDGAVVIRGDRVAAARCTLPVSSRTDLPARYGMRHRAAIALTDDSDAEVIVVSEQTGDISFVKNGELQKLSGADELASYISGSLTPEPKPERRVRSREKKKQA